MRPHCSRTCFVRPRSDSGSDLYAAAHSLSPRNRPVDRNRLIRWLRHLGVCIAWGVATPAAGASQTTARAEVQAAVERFLSAAGAGDVDALATMFAPGASIASARLRDGRWVRPLSPPRRGLPPHAVRPCARRIVSPSPSSPSLWTTGNWRLCAPSRRCSAQAACSRRTLTTSPCCGTAVARGSS